MLDRVNTLIKDILSLSWQLELSGEVSFVETVDVKVDLGQVRRIISMESVDLVLLNLFQLIFRHEVSSLNTLKRLELGLLLDHELVDRVDEDETIIAS